MRASLRFVALAAVTALAILVLLDIVVVYSGLLAAQLRPSDIDSARAKLLLAGRYADARVVCVGDSRVLTAIDPAQVSAVCGCGPGYNAAFSSADPPLARVVVHRLLSRLSPDLVVMGVSPWELSDAADVKVNLRAREILAPWELAEFGEPTGRRWALLAIAETMWQMLRYRSEIRSTLIALANRQPPDDRRGFLPLGGRQLDPERLATDIEVGRRRAFQHFETTGQRADALRELLSDLDRAGVRAMLVSLPLHPLFRQRVAVELGEFQRAMRQLASTAGVIYEVIYEDLLSPTWLDTSDFQDTVHVTEAGAGKVSRHLGALIRDRMSTPRYALQ